MKEKKFEWKRQKNEIHAKEKRERKEKSDLGVRRQTGEKGWNYRSDIKLPKLSKIKLRGIFEILGLIALSNIIFYKLQDLHRDKKRDSYVVYIEDQ